ncbi:MAG: hypothetical protein M3N18_02855 [Actinomycetota bacterium]|nr:hypothetical protein [Actinomycetota bacterium]
MRGGRSFNYQTREYEEGVAVFPDYATPEGDYRIELLNSFPLAVTWVRCRTRPAYRAYGREVGVGGGA